MSKFITALYPNRVHYLSDGTEAAFENGEATVPAAYDKEMLAAGFEMEKKPKSRTKTATEE